jgi:hypothetical protein
MTRDLVEIDKGALSMSKHISRRSLLKFASVSSLGLASAYLPGSSSITDAKSNVAEKASALAASTPFNIEAYASATSVSPGETINFHVRTDPPNYEFQVFFYRKGKEENTPIDSGTGISQNPVTPANSSETGCNWPAVYPLPVPENWSSGVYSAQFFIYIGLVPVAKAEVLFVVKAAALGTNSKTLLQLTFTTDEA